MHLLLVLPGSTSSAQADLCANIGTLTHLHTLRHTLTRSHTLVLPFPLPTQPFPALQGCQGRDAADSPAAALPHPLALLPRTSLAHGGAGRARCCELGYWGKCPLHCNEERAARQQTRSKASLFSFLGCRHMRGCGRGGKERREPETAVGALSHLGVNAKQTPPGGSALMNGILSHQPDRGGIS